MGPTLFMIFLAVTYLKIPLQARFQGQRVSGQTASYVEGFAVEEKLDFLDRGVVNFLAEFGHSIQNGWGSTMKLTQARLYDMPEVLLGPRWR